MAQPTNLFDRYDRTTRGSEYREEVARVIMNTSPMETPFLSMTRRGKKPGNTRFEWEEERLRDASHNAQIEGDAYGADAQTAPYRYENFCQISSEGITVSDTVQHLNPVDGTKELARLTRKAGMAIKRDIELGVTSLRAANGGGSSTARVSAGGASLCGIKNTQVGVGGSPASPALNNTTYGRVSVAGTAGTTKRGLTISMLDQAVRDVTEGGGKPRQAYMSLRLKEGISRFLHDASATSGPRIATQYQDQGKSPRRGSTAQAAVDVYNTDVGPLDLIYDLNMQKPHAARENVLVIDPDVWEVCYLRAFKTRTMGVRGDSHDRLLVTEYGLKCKALWSNALILGVDPATAVAR